MVESSPLQEILVQHALCNLLCWKVPYTARYARDWSEFGVRIKGVSKLDRHRRADKTNTTQMLPKRAGHLFLFSNLLVESNVSELHQKVSKLLPRKWKMYSTVVLLLSKSDQFRLLGFNLAGRAAFRHHYKHQGNIRGYYFRSRHTYTGWFRGPGGFVIGGISLNRSVSSRHREPAAEM